MVELSEYEYRLCELFAQESAKTQQQIEFGQKTTAPRAVKEIARDNLIGKMAEAAIVKMLWLDFGLHLPVNYQVYPRGECDDNDLALNGWTIDIKATRCGRFLLLEKSKVNFRRDSGTSPDIIIMCRVPWDMETDAPQGRSVELVGCISIKRLTAMQSETVQYLKAGETIPGTSCKLQADNYAVRFSDLYDIKKAFDYIIKHKKDLNQ